MYMLVCRLGMDETRLMNLLDGMLGLMTLTRVYLGASSVQFSVCSASLDVITSVHALLFVVGRDSNNEALTPQPVIDMVTSWLCLCALYLDLPSNVEGQM